MKTKHEGKKKIKLNKKTISLIVLAIAIPVLAFSTYHLVTYFVDAAKVKSQSKDYENKGNITVSDPNANVEYPSTDAEGTPYWDYIKMDLMSVDFNELKETNSDVAGWITVPGTNVNYPYVQTTDNDYYLTRDFSKQKNKAGWLFMDYRNNKTEYGKNTIIYAHNMANKTMFGSLKTLLTKDWFNKEENRIIKTSNEKYNALWQIFSVYTIVTTNDYIWTDENFSSIEQYKQFLNKIKGRSYTDFNTQVTENDRILTLSTCHGSNRKLVVHAKLIKVETR